MEVPQSSIPNPQVPCLALLPPLSLYIHIPWCIRKCPYCDFNSHEARGAVPEKEYVTALIADLEAALPAVCGRTASSVFIGGGTPSVFSPDGIDTLLAAVRARLPVDPLAEITLEANPGTFEAGKFQAFRSAGVNRLSVGIQSFNPRHLQSLGRIHDEREARAAIEIARRNFDNVNLDLMYGLPGQRFDEALADIAEAVRFEPQHISAYHLTVEPNTYFHRYPPQVPDDDTAAEMQKVVEETLAAAGYEHYETSAFAKRMDSAPDCAASGEHLLQAHASPFTARAARCAHNLNYWTFGDYLGIGAGAHSKISFPGRIVRQARQRQPLQYMQTAASASALQEHEIAPSEIAFEFMMNALRLNDGFPAALFSERTGLPLSVVRGELQAAEGRGLVVREHGRIAPTALGRRFLNDLLLLFLAAQPAPSGGA
jgi:coproporphyrinogen III oxidase-like Fe-S oxidoreductase